MMHRTNAPANISADTSTATTPEKEKSTARWAKQFLGKNTIELIKYEAQTPLKYL